MGPGLLGSEKNRNILQRFERETQVTNRENMFFLRKVSEKTQISLEKCHILVRQICLDMDLDKALVSASDL